MFSLVPPLHCETGVLDLHTRLEDGNNGIINVILRVQDNHVCNPPATKARQTASTAGKIEQTRCWISMNILWSSIPARDSQSVRIRWCPSSEWLSLFRSIGQVSGYVRFMVEIVSGTLYTNKQNLLVVSTHPPKMSHLNQSSQILRKNCRAMNLLNTQK